LRNKKVAIAGAGRLVGKPLSAWMSRQKTDFNVLDKRTADLAFSTLKADVLISGVGKKNLIKGNMVKEGAVVIDVGGDVDFKSVSKRAGFITPVFGGVGPLTVAYLLYNLVKMSK
jgi:methylenetetrahydrofolate dehydrogenase (NADP+) / methenyltetrahydrofolate cyclohydrolase